MSRGLLLGASIGVLVILASELELLRAFQLTSFDLSRSKARVTR